MKAQEFCYWFQGFFELTGATTLTEEQVQIVKNHLNLVFASDIDLQDPKRMRRAFQDIHDGREPNDEEDDDEPDSEADDDEKPSGRSSYNPRYGRGGIMKC